MTAAFLLWRIWGFWGSSEADGGRSRVPSLQRCLSTADAGWMCTARGRSVPQLPASLGGV